MNEWKALYLKELKENRTVFVFLLAITAVASMVSTAAAGWDSTTPSSFFAPSTFSATVDGIDRSFSSAFSPYMLWALLPYIILFVLPFMLTHSFAQEIKGQTHYLLLSLPASRIAVFLCKIAALVSVAVAVFVLATAATHALYLRLMELADIFTGVSVTKIAPRHLWLLIGEVYFSVLFLLLGIGSGIAGLRLVVRRFQGLMAAVFVGCTIYLYLRLLSPAREIFAFLFGSYRIPLINDSDYSGVSLVRVGSASDISSGHDVAVYTILFGMALIGLGVFLFDRRAEA